MIKCIRLISGEDVIAEFADDPENATGSVVLKNPVQIAVIPSRTQGTGPNFGFMPFPITSNERDFNKKITIKLEHILFFSEPAEDFVTQYNQVFGAGLVTPTKKIIV